ncbi:MAG: site-2 protease family protein [Phycisphaerales bacterium]
MESLGFAFDLALVIFAFGGIIAIHELGHFVAARWAGIRVLAFAIGFGPALCSWRKGLGFRRGSSEPEYQARLRAAGPRTRRGIVEGVWPTEYRLNFLPLGGYVKMLGQEDLDPGAQSTEPDSYQRCLPWKRMVVISAGVIANIVSAAIFFVIAFSIGMRDVQPKVGAVVPGRPAAEAAALNAAALGITDPGLRPRDTILAVNGDRPRSFAEVGLAVAMTARGGKVDLEVERPGVPQPLRFSIEPKEDPATRMLALGFAPALSGWVYGSETRLTNSGATEVRGAWAALGLAGVEPGMALVRAGDRRSAGEPGVPGDAAAVLTPYDLEEAMKRSGGASVEVVFRGTDGREAGGQIAPEPEYETQAFELQDEGEYALTHVAGLVPVMMVRSASAEQGAGYAAGLREGDVFARLGDAEWPSVAQGVDEIRRAERSIVVTVWRPSAPGNDDAGNFVELGKVPVRNGRIGFGLGTTAGSSARLARWPTLRAVTRDGAKGTAPEEIRPAGARLELPAGARVVAVEGEATPTLHAVRDRLRALAAAAGRGTIDVRLDVETAYAEGPARRQVVMKLGEAERAALAELSWTSPIPAAMWEAEHVLIRAAGPLDALGLGLSRTKSFMINVYLTIARLFQGTVRVEHLQGPVGIAHAGTIFAERGYVWLLFFMALVSVNLAVVNFLPMPIVDGGQFLFLLWEQCTGRPVSVRVQNAATLVGLVLICSLFLVVTYNDIASLISRLRG